MRHKIKCYQDHLKGVLMKCSIEIGNIFNKWSSQNLHQKLICPRELPASKNLKGSKESDSKSVLHIPSQNPLEHPLPKNRILVNQKTIDVLGKYTDLLGKTVANNLLQYDPKDCKLIKIFDLFYYEQGNLNPRITSVAPFNNFGNFIF